MAQAMEGDPAVRELREGLKRLEKMSSTQRWRRMIETGLIDKEGRFVLRFRSSSSRKQANKKKSAR